MADKRVGVGRWCGLVALVVLLTGASAGRTVAPPARRGPLTIQDEQQIETFQIRVGGHAQAGRFEEATKALQLIAELRERRQGRGHRQSIDARLAVERWSRLNRVAKKDRSQFLQALRGVGAAGGLASRHDYR